MAKSSLPITECDDCGQEFDSKNALAGHSRGPCNPDNREVRNCAVCGTQFKAWPSETRTTCRPQCANQSRSKTLEGQNLGVGNTVSVECDSCLTEVQKWKSQVDPYDHHFCNRYCLVEWKKDNGLYPQGGSSLRYVEEADLEVRSGWEEGLVLLLESSDVKYEYEPRSFDLGFKSYTPDFMVRDFVIEVKGQARDDDSAESFMEHYPEYTYVVVGVEIPCDIHVPYSQKEELLEVFE